MVLIAFSVSQGMKKLGLDRETLMNDFQTTMMTSNDFRFKDCKFSLGDAFAFWTSLNDNDSFGKMLSSLVESLIKKEKQAIGLKKGSSSFGTFV